MREVRRLAPYAAFSALVVAATATALVVSTLGIPVGLGDTAASPSASTTAVVRPATGLSPSGRLAYWRTEPNGDRVLWAANTDNSLRRGIAKVADARSVTVTKWAADGSAIAYVEEGRRLVVSRLDGTRTAYDLPADLAVGGWRIVDHHFSPSGARIAATIQRRVFGEYDLVVSTAAGSWTRLTTIGDVHASDWISEDELLVWTSGGVVARLDASAPDRLRPLTSLFGASPILAQDGRVYFLGGAGFATPQGFPQFGTGPAVWSMTVDGDDLRRETDADIAHDVDRLDGVLPAGYVVHDGRSRTEMFVTRTAAAPLSDAGGTLEGAAASADGRYLIGFGPTTIQRFDVGADGRIASGIVLLGSADQGSAWFPRPPTLAHVATDRPPAPAARYAFALGGHLWTMGPDGVAALLEVAPQQRSFGLAIRPRWSPTGDRILAIELIERASLQLVPVVVGPDRLPRPIGSSSSDAASYAYVGAAPTWSPDGTKVVTIAGTPGERVRSGDAPRIVVILDPAAGVVRTFPGREAYWTKTGIVVLSPGAPVTNSSARTDQALELWDGTAQRQLATIAALAGDRRTGLSVDEHGAYVAQTLSASDDGAYLGIHLGTEARGVPSRIAPVFAVVRVRDGTPALIIGSDETVSDEDWSPVGDALGYTRRPGRPPYGGMPAHAVVRDIESGAVLVDVEGRFAGWSPDGSWIFVARDDGLYARPLAGGELRRFASVGVLVSTTKP